jgi:hypothetical protein
MKMGERSAYREKPFSLTVLIGGDLGGWECERVAMDVF